MKRVSQRCVDSFALETLEPRSMMAADLVPGGVTVMSPNFPQTSPTRTFTFNVANMGTTAVPAGVVVDFYLSRDGVLDGGDRRLRQSVLPRAIAPGQSVTYTKVFRVPAEGDGDYRLIAKVDASGSITESDETNNNLPSPSFNIFNPPRIDSITINKLYIRPGSQATITVHGVHNVDPSIPVQVYRTPGRLQFAQLTGYTPANVLLGTATRVGSDYTFTFVADGSWVGEWNSFFVRIQPPNRYLVQGLEVEGRRIVPPTIGSFTFSPLIRGQLATFTASNVSADTNAIWLAFDSNFNNRLDSNEEFLLLTRPTLSAQFMVHDWFPSAPTRIFVIAARTQTIRTVYSMLLTAH